MWSFGVVDLMLNIVLSSAVYHVSGVGFGAFVYVANLYSVTWVIEHKRCTGGKKDVSRGV